MTNKLFSVIIIVVLVAITLLSFAISPLRTPVAEASSWSVQYSPADCQTVTITGPYDNAGYPVHVTIRDWYSGQWLWTQSYPDGYFANGASFNMGRIGTHPYLDVYIYGWWEAGAGTPVVWYIYHQEAQCVSSPLHAR